MANDSRPGRKIKDEENNTPQKKLTTDTLALRRSTREFSSRKQTTSSPSHMRKSERLENRVSTNSLVSKESERVENQVLPTPLRRSDRGKKQTSSNSSGSKKSGKGSGTSDIKRKKGFVKDKIAKQLTLESTKIKKIERRDSELVGRKRKIMVCTRLCSRHNGEGILQQVEKEIEKQLCKGIRIGALQFAKGYRLM
ncbi:hypothetical protein LguiB_008407 [Lonicera macranthoides]